MNNDENYQDFVYDWSTRTIIAFNYGGPSGSFRIASYTSDNTFGDGPFWPEDRVSTGTARKLEQLEYLRRLSILFERGTVQIPITKTKQTRHWTIKEKGKLA